MSIEEEIDIVEELDNRAFLIEQSQGKAHVIMLSGEVHLTAAKEIQNLRNKIDKFELYVEHSSTCATYHGKMRNCSCGLEEVFHG